MSSYTLIKSLCSQESRVKQELFTFHSPRALKEVSNNSITKFLTPLLVSRIAVQIEFTAVFELAALWEIVSDIESSGVRLRKSKYLLVQVKLHN